MLALRNMSSYVGIGQNPQYVLPFQMDAVPSSFKSNLAPRPLNCNLQTVNVPSTSGTATVGGLSTIQVPLGQAAYIVNPYLRFRVRYTATVDTAALSFKGAAQSAFALISTFQSSINSTLIDNIQNFPQVAEQLLNHSSSKEWLANDGAVLLNSTTTVSNGAVVVGTPVDEVYCLPLLGMLGSQQAFPAWAVNGVLQLNINWAQALANAYYYTAGTFTIEIADVAFVYDRVAVEGDFIAKMRADMANSGAKYVYSFTNYQSLAQPSAAQQTLNTSVNVSSLRAVVMSTTTTAHLTSATQRALSLRLGLTNFQVSLDGRLINANILNAVTSPAICFIEMNKCFSRMFDSSVTDNSTKATYLTDTFAVGVSATRCAEGLSFQGSPASVVGIQMNQTDNSGTNFITYVADQSLLIGADGACDLVR